MICGEKWSDKDVAFIKLNYYVMSDREMSIILNRSVTATTIKRIRSKCLIKEKWQRCLNLDQVINRMQELIEILSNNPNLYQKDKYTLELKKLSGIR